MILEQPIAFVTAKLALQKGFKLSKGSSLNKPYYTHDGIFKGDVTDLIKAIVRKEDKTLLETIDAPTQTLLKKWLRIEHKINVNVKHIPHNQRYSYNITGSYHDGVNGVLKSYDFKSFETEEEALEHGLQEALQLIK